MSLFALPPEQVPLAHRLRPTELADFAAFQQFDQSTQRLLLAQDLRAVIFWGPPGSGKTTLCRILGKRYASFTELSAIEAGVKDIKEIGAQARKIGRQSVVFIDEVHRFSRTQQEALLPYVEEGSIVLLGATTENPSFSIVPALLSRVRVITLRPLTESEQQGILSKALLTLKRTMSDEAQNLLIHSAAGDARTLLKLVDQITLTITEYNDPISRALLDENLPQILLRYDRNGELHYDMVSAFIKSMRGSDPDAALFYALRMIEGGEDPRFILRRMVIFAAEDIGLAEPFALTLAVSTLQAFEAVGLPEGKIPLAQAIVYLATCPKSNRSYLALKSCEEAVRRHPEAAVPNHLRNAPTKLMESLGYGEGYKYPHDYPGGFVPGEKYLPEALQGEKFYHPSEQGREAKLRR